MDREWERFQIAFSKVWDESLDFHANPLMCRKNVSPETLQTFGIMAIGLGFVLIGVGGLSTYHASQKLQHAAELRQVEQKGEMEEQILTLLMKNQELRSQQLQRQTEQPAPPSAPAPASPPPSAAPAPDPAPPAVYYRPPAPAPPAVDTPPPVAEGPARPQISPPAPAPEASEPPRTAMTPQRPSGWEEPESLEPDMPMRHLSVRQQRAIANSLRAHGRHLVTIESSYGDPVSREFAQELGAAFTEAHWAVKGIAEHRGLPLASGVTVSAASFPPRPETRAVYDALLSAGIAVTQQLNPRQHSSETVVLVGAPQ